jgi:hypothetical protein
VRKGASRAEANSENGERRTMAFNENVKLSSGEQRKQLFLKFSSFALLIFLYFLSFHLANKPTSERTADRK